MRRLGIAIPTWERTDLLEASYRHVVSDDRVEQVAIVDDASSPAVRAHVQALSAHPKIQVFHNKGNLGCYQNKGESSYRLTSDWMILFDSDNILTHKYLDALYEIPTWTRQTLYMPVFASPAFDYRDYSDVIISKDNLREYVDRPRFLTALNTGNFFANRDEFVLNFDPFANPLAADSLYLVYCWLRDGGVLQFVPNLVYTHRIHPGSNYLRYAEQTKPFAEALERRLREGVWI
jgi:glycosyltransferase involved in cell wall biosynthesis